VLPEDRRTRIAIASSSGASSSGHDLDEASSADLDVVGTGLPRLLLERVEHIDGLGESRDVEDPVLDSGAYPDLEDSRPDGRHGLPIARHQAELDSPELGAGYSARVGRGRH